MRKQLRNHAAWIEPQLGIVAGQFGGRRERLSLREIYSPGAHRQRDAINAELEKAGEPRPRQCAQAASHANGSLEQKAPATS